MVRLALGCVIALVACQNDRHQPATASGSESAMSPAPPRGGAPLVGAHAPAVQLTTMANTKVALASITSTHDNTIVVFYRGFY
ncbi:MAG TPA: hypothetical protein VLX92_29790 [Kofleriaceae bacterium]|nr:hypothetical protein [Kofleriaceae bacterium]